MSRQRLRPSLGDSSHVACPRCQGVGTIRSVESMALAILRLAGEDARKERTGRLIVQVPINVATYLVNEKRAALRDIEEKCSVELVLVPNKDMETPEFSIRRVRHDELGLPENSQASFKIPTPAEGPDVGLQAKRPPPPQAAVTTIIPTAPAPAAPAPPPPPVIVVAPPPRRGLFGSLKTLLFGDGQPAPVETKEGSKQPVRGERKGREERGRSGHPDRDARRSGSRDGRDGGDRPRGGRDRADRNRGRDGERRPAQARGEAEAGRSEAPRGAEQKPRREQPPAKSPESVAAPQVQSNPGNAPEGAAAPRADGEKRSRRGGRRRRGRGGRGGEGAGPGAMGMGGNDMGHEDGAAAGSHGELDFRPPQESGESRPAQHELRGGSDSPPPAQAAQEVRVAAPPPPPPPPPERPAVMWSSAASSGSSGSDADRSQRDE
jgi:ribonuclease E